MIEFLIFAVFGAFLFVGVSGTSPGAMPPAHVAQPAPETAQVEFAQFRAALHDCARYLMAKDIDVLQGENPYFSRSYDEDHDGGDLQVSMFYPEFADPIPMVATAFFEPGNATTAPVYQCSAVGVAAPTWPVFTGDIYSDVKAQLADIGYDEINFPAEQKFFANCRADKPDAFILFNAGDGDRVVFATQGGDTAQVYCNNFGIKE